MHLLTTSRRWCRSRPRWSELRRHREEQRRQKTLLADEYEDHGLVFCQPNGKPLHERNISCHTLLPFALQRCSSTAASRARARFCPGPGGALLVRHASNGSVRVLAGIIECR